MKSVILLVPLIFFAINFALATRHHYISQVKPADQNIEKLVQSLSSLIKDKVSNKIEGCEIKKLTAIEYRYQIVAGAFYYVKVSI